MELPTFNLNATSVCLVLALVTLTYHTIRTIYNLYFHPLAKYPGPLLYRATRLAYLAGLIRGRLALDVLPMHRRYGPIVRIAPDELSISTPEAWKDIYGHRTGLPSGLDELPKSYIFYRNKLVPPSIVGEDREGHALLRRLMAPGFSERSMREQEPIIGSYVDLLVERLRQHAVDADRKDPITGLQGAKRPLDMTAWYNWTTFDMIGDLAFGEPFGSLDKAKYDPWVHAIAVALESQRFLLTIRHIGLNDILLPLVRLFQSSRREYGRRTRDMMERRMQVERRTDLIEGLLAKKDELKLDPGRIQMNAAVLILAGSETTATLLSGVTFLLLRHPECLRKATEEVRSTFRSEKDITLTSVARLEYMLACLNEALRRYPPVPFGLPRVTPKGGASIIGEFMPEHTHVAVWQYALYHSEEYFTDPFGYHPERFLQQDPRFAKDRLDALQPFSVGPRNCIGKNLAYAEMRLILARILYNFDMCFADEGKAAGWIDGQKAYTLWKKPPLEVFLIPVAR
ncbi:putative cytochrome P450 [Apodospora peruviana]|uniref:Cytochrome P450 n=1 Tax=Apodospora peruviana TaxID=516989 RepID=A0AAE0IAS3_9PEZI|nr:putative cytochrome P450 [Apodospora peruviana]